MSNFVMQQTSRSFYCFWGRESRQSVWVRSCGNFVLVPPDREKMRRVDFGEIFWPVTGSCRYMMDGMAYVLRPGNVWYYPPGSRHDYVPLEPFHYCWLTVAGSYAGTFFRMCGLKPGLNKAGTCPEHLFKSLGADIDCHTPEHRISALATALRIVAQVSLKRSMNSRKCNLLHDVRERIDSHLSEPELSVAGLAEIFSVHRGELSRSFHRTYGETVSDYIVSSRIRYAVSLLRDTDCSIGEVAAECGYRSANYFSKVFLAKVGVTPSRFRRSCRSQFAPC